MFIYRSVSLRSSVFVLACLACTAYARRAQTTIARLQHGVHQDVNVSSSARSIADSDQEIPKIWKALLAGLALATPATGLAHAPVVRNNQVRANRMNLHSPMASNRYGVTGIQPSKSIKLYPVSKASGDSYAEAIRQFDSEYSSWPPQERSGVSSARPQRTLFADSKHTIDLDKLKDKLEDMLQNDIPDIWKSDPDWDIAGDRLSLMSLEFDELDELDEFQASVAMRRNERMQLEKAYAMPAAAGIPRSNDTSIVSMAMRSNDLVQLEKAYAIEAAVAISDIFDQPDKIAIGMSSVFGHAGTVAALRKMGHTAKSFGGAIQRLEAIEAARQVVHEFSQAVVNLAATYMMLPNMCRITLRVLKQDNGSEALKTLLTDLSWKIGENIAGIIHASGLLGVAVFSPSVVAAAGSAYGIYGIYSLFSSKPAAKLRDLLQQDANLILSAVERDMKEMPERLSHMGDQGKAYLKELVEGSHEQLYGAESDSLESMLANAW